LYGEFQQYLYEKLESIRASGSYKHENAITTPQGNRIELESGGSFLNLCSNNYLGLAQHPEVIQAAKSGLQQWGYGMASVRVVCGTQTQHKLLERKLSDFLCTEDTILYPSCFDANGGLFDTLLGEADAVISDELNHASIIDGVRLCKAKRYRYRNNDLQDLEEKLKAADSDGARFKLITTDGIFSMDGYIAQVDIICDLAEKYNALVHVDDSHGVGVVGKNGRGTHEHCDCMDRVDILTGTLGKALGGASGGYTSGRKEIVEYLRQNSRSYLFTNTVAPPVVAGSLKALELATGSSRLRNQLRENTACFRQGLEQSGFELLQGDHPIVPVMLYDEVKAGKLARVLVEQGIFVVAFSYPIVPRGQARIRTQISAALSRDDIEFAVQAFRKAKTRIGL